ncbi:hypothetical protein N7373_23730 [Achromobacter mucicolens]|nr:hypothetical protein [Achromobacter mucicolens]MDH0094469.1 hypothetical protein [Achromobacter mucicolens]
MPQTLQYRPLLIEALISNVARENTILATQTPQRPQQRFLIRSP